MRPALPPAPSRPVGDNPSPPNDRLAPTHDEKPAVRREAEIEALVIASLRRLGRAATSADIWRLIDSSFDVSFETRRSIFQSLLDRGFLVMEEYRNYAWPEPLVRLYRLGITIENTHQDGGIQR